MFTLLIYITITYLKFILNFLVGASRRRIKYYQIDKEKIELNQKDEFFNRLVEINFKYLDQYYLQTKEQADKSFF